MQNNDAGKLKNTKHVILALYVLSKSAQSTKAIECIRSMCEKELAGRCRLQIIDVQEQPEIAEKNAIIATPTLIKYAPPPLRRVLGNLSNIRDILTALQLPEDIWSGKC